MDPLEWCNTTLSWDIQAWNNSFHRCTSSSDCEFRWLSAPLPHTHHLTISLHRPLPSPLAYSFLHQISYYECIIPTQKVGKTPVTPPKSQVCMGNDDRL
ncbi:hypothetical protein EVAR_16814_1 [Eumeta japonica]|uniref:Uncharacterized protein n=1 Tax=Eumeta variegata TaxID=151549 RepID=A0A4C1V321_EUMVA|nr:hypothetical protein EVAR_16814_1 [Eumeta japonica]